MRPWRLFHPHAFGLENLTPGTNHCPNRVAVKWSFILFLVGTEGQFQSPQKQQNGQLDRSGEGWHWQGERNFVTKWLFPIIFPRGQCIVAGENGKKLIYSVGSFEFWFSGTRDRIPMWFRETERAGRLFFISIPYFGHGIKVQVRPKALFCPGTKTGWPQSRDDWELIMFEGIFWKPINPIGSSAFQFIGDWWVWFVSLISLFSSRPVLSFNKGPILRHKSTDRLSYAGGGTLKTSKKGHIGLISKKS